MAVPGKISTGDNQFTSTSNAPTIIPEATERTKFTSPSRIQFVLNEKEQFELRCYPFYEKAIDKFDAEQNEITSSHLQQKIKEIIAFYEDEIYSDLTEDFKAIILNLQAHPDDDEKQLLYRCQVAWQFS